jgi:hypothetical protein
MLSKRLGHDIKNEKERKKERDENVIWERERKEQVFY